MGIICLTCSILHILQNPMLPELVKSKENINVFLSAITGCSGQKARLSVQSK